MKSLIRYISFLLFALIMVFSVKAVEPASKPQANPVMDVVSEPAGTSLIAPAPDYMPGRGNSFPFGQTQRYSVVFRGNGEAVVTLNAAFSNATEQPLSELKFRVPKGIPTDIFAYQIIGQRQCIQYDYDTKKRVSPTLPPALPSCLQYQEPDIYQYIQGYNIKYQKAESVLQTDTITVTLPQPVTANGIGGIMLYFRSGGYTSKDIFGGYNFSFETLKIEDKIQSLQVGISTDAELQLKGTASNMNYRFTAGDAMLKEQSSVGMAAAPMANSQFDSYYQQIGQGMMVKTSSNLQPLDSYTVNGRYAKSALHVYAKELTATAVGLMIFIVVIVLLIKWLIKKSSGKSAVKNTSLAVHPIIFSIGGSFASALLIVVYTLGLMVLVRTLPSYLDSDITSLVIALFLVVSLGIYGLLLFAAPVIIGIRKSPVWGVATLGLTILWIILFTFVMTVFFFVTNGSVRDYPPVYPMMGTATSGVSVPESIDLQK